MTIRILRDDLSELLARSVDVTLVPPSAAAASVSREAIHQPDGSWKVEGIDFPKAGNWMVKVLISVSTDGSLPILDATIVIEGRR